MARKRSAAANGLKTIQTEKEHPIVSDLAPQTPFSDSSRSNSPAPGPPPAPNASPFLRWVIIPSESLKLLAIPLLLYANWEVITPHVAPGTPNPFTRLFLLSGRVDGSSKEDPRYQKTYWDLAFLAYYVVFFSLIRETLTKIIGYRVGRYFGLRKLAKLDRFGEQFYCFVYMTVMGAWGYRIMGQLPTWWYSTEHFWIDYPHWAMKPELKRYYLMHSAYWCQQLLVLVLGLEKPRKDYHVLVAHHFVTLWLIGWSYLINLTLIGNAVYMSMDVPDAIFALAKCLNYAQFHTAKNLVFAIMVIAWTYFRHYQNIMMQISVVQEFDLMPAESMQWNPPTGAWLVWWMKWQIFAPLFLLHCLNAFWYYLIMRVIYRAITTATVDDDRSDDEGDDEDDTAEKED
ncbi:longevity assurance proteins LAG1 LAC1 [Flagelloscypha sp. PMI_526]|nr:longevity assurance proteins LAG1 LAC1 [Flagelloscypha sp. PMI_526]